MTREEIIEAARRPGAKIAVVRANGLGDLVFSLPALEALRAAFPRAEITLLGRAWHEELFRDRPSPIDRVIVCPPARGISVEPSEDEDAAALDAFFARMAAERFDVAVQMHGGGRYSNPFVMRLGARATVGLRDVDAPPLDRWVRYRYFHHEILRYLEVAALLGAEPVVVEPRLAVTDADRAASLAAVPESHEPFAVVHPGASDPRRRWAPERFGAVARRLASRMRVVVTGGDAERETVNAVVEHAGADVIDTCGKLSLPALVGLLPRARVVVSNDSGPLHLAAALGAPAVGIYWIANMINAGPVRAHRKRGCVSWTLRCPACGTDATRDRCSHTASFVHDVDVDDVWAQVEDVLEVT